MTENYAVRVSVFSALENRVCPDAKHPSPRWTDDEMSPTRLSPLDASFLELETPTAHMHVGWVAIFDPPGDRPPPSFTAIRKHIAGRLPMAPRYRQRLAWVPLGLHDPVWVDDEGFDLSYHVRETTSREIGMVVDGVMSAPLDRCRPLWELSVATRLPEGRIGVVGKVHHCMVDGIAAVELAALLLDPTLEPAAVELSEWEPRAAPSSLRLLAAGVRDRAREELDLVRLPASIARSPKRLFSLAADARRAVRALGHSLSPPAPPSVLNEPISVRRHLAVARRSLGDLKRIRSRFGATVNDVVLAASAGATRRLLEQRGEQPIPLKAMVPVNVRGSDGVEELGNRVALIFVDLPCDEPDPVRRLEGVKLVMDERKSTGEARGAEAVVNALGYAPHRLQHALEHMIASARTFNLVVSNIPGPSQPLYMLGCPLREAYPVVPLADDHAVSIGVTTVTGEAFFGVYADRELLPDADRLATYIDEAIDELFVHC